MTMLRHIADTIISFCGIPTVNPTVPSAVSSLGVTPRPGAISFVWPVPTIRPIGTEYRLMEATVNSYGAASEAWRGDALGTTITKANTAGYYFWLDSLGSNGSYFTFPGVSSGMPGNALLTDAPNIAPEAVTTVLVNTVAGPVDTYSATAVPTLVCSLSVPAQPLDTQMVVTATGNVDHTAAPGTQGSTCATISDTALGSSIASVANTIARNPNTSDQVARQRFSIKRVYAVSSGTAKAFALYGQGMSFASSGSVCNLADVTLKVEVIKR